jgi:hypothetical protein
MAQYKLDAAEIIAPRAGVSHMSNLFVRDNRFLTFKGAMIVAAGGTLIQPQPLMRRYNVELLAGQVTLVASFRSPRRDGPTFLQSPGQRDHDPY